MKVVIIGGVAGGASTAARLRRMDEFADIIMLERGEYISFANCGLPYHIGGVIKERQNLLLLTPEKLYEWFRVDTRVLHEVLKINRDKKELKVKNHKTGEEYVESYDKLVLSPGAAPVLPPLPGIDLDGVFSLRNIPDMDKIIEYLNECHPQRAVVVGGGFIGVELAENLHERGIHVSMIEMMDQVMAPVDFEMASMVHQHLRFNNIRLALGDGLKSIEKTIDRDLKITLSSEKEIEADLVIMAIGVRPENTLAKNAGLELGSRGTIKTNEHMQTNDPNIYAVGDAAEVVNAVTGEPTSIPLAGPASKQARIAADHIVGRNAKYNGVQGTSVVKVFDLTVAATGLNERQLNASGVEHQSAIVHVSNHAGYYPGAVPMALKLIYDPKGVVLGAQAVGMDGVDKRIDVIATAIHGKMSVFDLEELELAYAPPFSSSRDPVNIVANAAGNSLRDDISLINWDQVDKLDRNAYAILDVRELEELQIGKVKDSINIPLGQLRERIDELPKNKKMMVYCQVGKRAYFACRLLKQHGFDVYNLSGGYKTYAHATEKQSNFDVFEHVTINKLEEIHEVVSMELMEGNEIKVDACGQQCPGPILTLAKAMKEAKTGDVINIEVTDFGFLNDVQAWTKSTGNNLLSVEQGKGIITARIQKGLEKVEKHVVSGGATEGKTMVVFSGDFDKAIAAFIIANGAAAMGHPVTIFFTFWGLNILRKDDPPRVKKNLIERMFGWMMPRGARKLTLSQMHMAGMGTGMIKGIMKKHNVASLPEMIEIARQNGVRLQACQMSMDLMGIKKEELLEGIEIVGVASFIASSDNSNATLFI
ncbi:MAG: FAD-dependent oxidoreductase [Anaerolineales bacterium]|nr:FAD-dependent oxidoreductase [Anaerolineales bacterium]